MDDSIDLEQAKASGWTAPPDSPFRSLTPEEVADCIATAERTEPRFEGHFDPADRRRHLDPDADAPWEQLHPVMRAVWTRRGLAPQGD